MRLEPERFPDPAHRRLGQSGLGGHRCPRPVRGVFGLTLQRRHDHRLDLGVGDHARRTRTWLISQPVEARLHEPPPPHPYRLRPHTDLSSHLLVGFTCRATQHDPTPLRQRLRRLRSPRPPLQRFPLLVGQHQLSYRPAPTRHAPSLQLVIEFMAQDTRSFRSHLSSGAASPRCGRRRWPESPTTVLISIMNQLPTVVLSWSLTSLRARTVPASSVARHREMHSLSAPATATPPRDQCATSPAELLNARPEPPATLPTPLPPHRLHRAA
jgi:hypothetical protein